MKHGDWFTTVTYLQRMLLETVARVVKNVNVPRVKEGIIYSPNETNKPVGIFFWVQHMQAVKLIGGEYAVLQAEPESVLGVDISYS